ncbi:MULTISPECIES: hypothetical protein [Nostocales]|uniref:Uncharacterized protein n=3 Tax=Nostocales TaxID=1161 RepID=A0A0C1R2G0_9CYAN|nr:hypothetical protein [Tolypothrix bouteillei]KAF3884724.1 hypothetical protein DA73_0400003990 [Tolypothrix bouteillei VB521301]
MNVSLSWISKFFLSVSACVSLSHFATAQQAPTNPQQRTQTTLQKICSFDTVRELLPPASEKSKSLLSYLAQQGFIQTQDGSWVCYVSDPQKSGRYYTLFKVQQIEKKLVASSFLENDRMIEEQDSRSLDFFLMLIQNHTSATSKNLLDIREYIKTFITLIKQGKIKPSERGYLFNQPSRAFVFYNRLNEGNVKGTAITINLDKPQNLSSSPVFLEHRDLKKP